MESPKKNFIYNIIYQILVLAVPLITSPYLARIIGAEGVGIYSYTYSIVFYFMLICLLGVNNYGNRTIAKVKRHKEKISKNFWGIYTIQLFMGILMLIIYYIYIVMFNCSHKDIGIIQSIYIISSILDINWFFFGMEEFKKTITRNSIVKIGSVILIFLFVKEKSDVWKYTLIMSSMTLLSQVILWFFLKKYVRIEHIKWQDIKKHIKPNIVLFIPVIAVSIYKIMDKIMLGLIISVEEVGFYENAEKIINVPLVLITALGTVMLPRITNIISNGDYSSLKKYILKSFEFVSFLSFVTCFGLIATGYKFAILFFGTEFKRTGELIMLLAITIPFISFANVMRTQYLIPKEKDKIYVISVFCGALINLIMNLILIPKYKGLGACFGTIFAEISVMIYQTLSVKRELPIKKYICISLRFFIKSLIMFVIIYSINYLKINDIIRLLVQIFLGGFIYSILNIKYIFKLFDIDRLLNKFGIKWRNSHEG